MGAPYYRELPGALVIQSTQPEHAEQLEELQNLVFPTLAPEERFRAVHYLKHLELFPEGQFVALDGERVIGMSSTIRLNFNFNHADHTFADIIQGGYMTSHDPDGEWLYGADIGTHPEYRRRGIARALFIAWHELVRRLRMKGQVAVGMMSGYGAMKDRMSAEEYYEKLQRGELEDPTISAQLKVGFEMRGLLKNYLNDPVCDNCGIVIVLPAEKDVR